MSVLVVTNVPEQKLNIQRYRAAPRGVYKERRLLFTRDFNPNFFDVDLPQHSPDWLSRLYAPVGPETFRPIKNLFPFINDAADAVGHDNCDRRGEDPWIESVLLPQEAYVSEARPETERQEQPGHGARDLLRTGGATGLLASYGDDTVLRRSRVRAGPYTQRPQVCGGDSGSSGDERGLFDRSEMSLLPQIDTELGELLSPTLLSPSADADGCDWFDLDASSPVLTPLSDGSGGDSCMRNSLFFGLVDDGGDACDQSLLQGPSAIESFIS